jgi:hypothetical protein
MNEGSIISKWVGVRLGRQSHSLTRSWINREIKESSVRRCIVKSKQLSRRYESIDKVWGLSNNKTRRSKWPRSNITRDLSRRREKIRSENILQIGQGWGKDYFYLKLDFRKWPFLSRLTSYGRHGSDTTLSHPIFKIKPNA